MNVRELRKLLKEFPDDAIVILQSDREGNYFHRVSGADLDEVFDYDTEPICDHQECQSGRYAKWPYDELDIDDEVAVVIFP